MTETTFADPDDVRPCVCTNCAWDGPAGVVASDGRVLAGLVDRMGLRPVRWCSDDRGWLYIGSESGVFGLDAARIVANDGIQVHGGIGFTWEHDMQLFYRRAKFCELFLGDAGVWREKVATGLAAAFSVRTAGASDVHAI